MHTEVRGFLGRRGRRLRLHIKWGWQRQQTTGCSGKTTMTKAAKKKKKE